MSQQNEGHSPFSSDPQSMVGTSLPGDALVPGGAALPSAVSYVSPNGQARAPEVVSGGMDRSWFFHSLRRRWLLALCMGLVLGVGVAGFLWWMFPESASAVALYQVASQDPSLVFKDIGNETKRFEILQKTQLALLKSHFVLQDAVRKQEVLELGVLQGEDNPVKWLDDNLVVQFPEQSEILRISLTGNEEEGEDLRKIVDEVARAYEEQVLYADRRDRTETREILANALDELNQEIRQKMEDYEALAKELGSADDEGTSAQSRLLLAQISSQSSKLDRMRTELLNMRTKLEITKRRLKDPSFMQAQLAQAAQSDPTVQVMQQQLVGIDMQLNDVQVRARRNSQTAKRLARQRQALNQRMSQLSQQARQSASASQLQSPSALLRQYEGEAQLTMTALATEMERIRQEREKNYEELEAMSEKSVELAVRQAELDQLKEVANEMGLRIESWDVEMQAPQRIRQRQRATVEAGINTLQRYMIASGGGIATFALSCLVIGYLEFRSRRLNGPQQMDEGLGIRVVGTLPSLSNRKMLDPNHPIVAQLTESIDGVRTLLMHDSTTKQRQVVMITSAMTLEGRTTVASQLAASLARAGRRTLLVDGDLRRPALHQLFDVPLEDGLCEVLRGDTELSEVVRPTHAENLWLMTAGYCDVDAIQALARETRLDAIFKELRADYDFIIIDAAPVVGLSDSLLFGQYCDGVLLSVLRDHSEVPKVYQAAELLRGVGIRLLGTVVNGVSAKSDQRVTQLRMAPPRAERGALQAT